MTSSHQCLVKPINLWKERYQGQIQREVHCGFLMWNAVMSYGCEDKVKRNVFVANLVVLHKDGKDYTWSGESCMEEFYKFLFLDDGPLAAEAKNTQCLLMRLEDSIHLILNFFVLTMMDDLSIIFNSGRPIQVKVGSLTILDSY